MFRQSILLVTDLDDTLVGHQPEDRQALAILNRLLAAPECLLVYATGRSPASARALMAEVGLLEPAALVASVGTAIYFAERPNEPDPGWWETLKPGWDPQVIDALVASYPQLRPQSPAEQGPFKRSYFLAPEHEHLLAALQADLGTAGLAVRLVYSSHRDLDILPEGGGKGRAVQYLQRRLGFAPTATVVCGDSGNDRALFETGSFGIAVGNARPELASWLDSGPPYPIFRARARCAAGILEGLHHWGFI